MAFANPYGNPKGQNSFLSKGKYMGEIKIFGKEYMAHWQIISDNGKDSVKVTVLEELVRSGKNQNNKGMVVKPVSQAILDKVEETILMDLLEFQVKMRGTKKIAEWAELDAYKPNSEQILKNLGN